MSSTYGMARSGPMEWNAPFRTAHGSKAARSESSWMSCLMRPKACASERQQQGGREEGWEGAACEG